MWHALFRCDATQFVKRIITFSEEPNTSTFKHEDRRFIRNINKFLSGDGMLHIKGGVNLTLTKRKKGKKKKEIVQHFVSSFFLI
jgi:hypothetical protein